MRVVLLNGTPANPSRVRALMDAIAASFDEQGLESEVLDLFELNVPFNDPSFKGDVLEHDHDGIRTLAQSVHDADVVVLGSPLYHGSFSGLLKVALDNLPGSAFKGKHVLLAGVSWGPRNASMAPHQMGVVARTMSGIVHNSTIGTSNEDYESQTGKNIVSSDEVKKRVANIVSDITSQLDIKGE